MSVFLIYIKKSSEFIKKKEGKKSPNWFLVKEISCLRYFASFPTEQKKYFGEAVQLAEHTKWDVSGEKKKKKRDKEKKRLFRTSEWRLGKLEMVVRFPARGIVQRQVLRNVWFSS